MRATLALQQRKSLTRPAFPGLSQAHIDRGWSPTSSVACSAAGDVGVTERRRVVPLASLLHPFRLLLIGRLGFVRATQE
ncbi:hypothetical protein MTO96_027385 [Rhipicephalus appendiculatus]